MYIHNTVISAEAYLELVTGKHWDLRGPNSLEEIAEIMADNGYDDLWDYALEDIRHIIDSNFDAVALVDIFGSTETDEAMHHIYRWFQLPISDPEVINKKLLEIEQSRETNYFSSLLGDNPLG